MRTMVRIYLFHGVHYTNFRDLILRGSDSRSIETRDALKYDTCVAFTAGI
jgi:hypothetical protein